MDSIAEFISDLSLHFDMVEISFSQVKHQDTLASVYIWSPFNHTVETLKRCYQLFFSSYLQVVIIEVALLYSVGGDLVAVVRLNNTVKKVTEQDI